jgi:alpha-L-fucosidase
VLRTLEGTPQTKVSILGYASELVEYKENFDAGIYAQSTPVGLLISAVNGQRFYTDRKWPNPVVIKIEHVKYKPVVTSYKQSTIDGAK